MGPLCTQTYQRIVRTITLQSDCRDITLRQAVLESPARAVEVLPAEYCPPAAIGLTLDAARVVAACFAHGQAFGQDRGKVDHRRQTIDGYTVRAFVRRPGAFPPRRIRSTRSTVDAEATVLSCCKVTHQKLATIEAAPLWAI